MEYHVTRSLNLTAMEQEVTH